MKKVITIVISIFLATNFILAQKPKLITQIKNTDDRGSFEIKGSLAIYMNSDSSVVIKMKAKAKKTGQTGTGRGVYAMALYDKDWNIVKDYKRSITLGARSPEGVNRRKIRHEIVMTGNEAKIALQKGFIAGLTVDATKNNCGIPRSLEEWKQAVKDFNEIIKVLDETVKTAKSSETWKIINGDVF